MEKKDDPIGKALKHDHQCWSYQIIGIGIEPLIRFVSAKGPRTVCIFLDQEHMIPLTKTANSLGRYNKDDEYLFSILLFE